MKKEVKAAEAASQEVLLLPAGKNAITETHQVDIRKELPDLNGAKVKQVNLTMDYWTPQTEGESRLLIFMRLVPEEPIPDFNDPNNLVKKDCAYFIEQTANGFQVLRNASSRLVSMARNFLEGEVYQVTFLGKRPNKTNNNQSFYWAVQPVELTAAS